MKAAILDGPESIRLGEAELPHLEDGETLLQVLYCGICGSDIHVLRGEHPTATFPRIPGHEFVGRVVEVCGKNEQGLKPGALAVAQPFFSCGNCVPCAKGRDNVCSHLQFMGIHVEGGFAQYVKVPTRKVYQLPEELDPRLAALTEPLAVAVHDVRSSGLQVGERALIIGGGPIGILIALVARYAGAEQVIISEISDYRRAFAQELGFETVNPLDKEADAALMELSGGEGFDVVFEVSGSAGGVASATRYARITGTVVIVGMVKAPVPVDLGAVFAKELTVRGVRIHSQYSFRQAVEILKNGALNLALSTLLSREYPLEEVEAAFAQATSGTEFFKILVRMEG